MNSSEAFELLVTIVKGFEGCFLHAYPDPASPLYKELSRLGLLRAYMSGRHPTPEALRRLSGAPWTIGYGETHGITEGMVWTQEEAELRLRYRLAQFLVATYQHCPALLLLEPERATACTSLAYNIGVGAFGASSVCRHTTRHEFESAAKSFLLWNKAGGAVMAGLTKRRKVESSIYSLIYGLLHG